MKKNKLIFILFILIAVLAAGGIFLQYFLSRTKFNTTDISGNSAGNFYNNGLFCEYNDTVYFSNPYDGYTLYQMTPQGTQARQVSTDKVSFINADNNYIYYVRDNSSKTNTNAFSFIQVGSNGLCRIKHNGKQSVLLDQDVSLYAALSGNYIYYVHYDKENSSTLYKIKIDGTEQEQVNKFPLLLSPSEDGSLCYNGLDGNHNIYRFNPSSDTSSLLYEGNCFNPTEDDSYLYFMDCDNDYHFTKVQKSTGEKTDISQCRIDTYNIYGNYVYYQKNEKDDYALCRRSLDGSKEEVIAKGIFCDINITSNYVYFREFKNQDIFYQTPTNGAVNVTSFEFETAD